MFIFISSFFCFHGPPAALNLTGLLLSTCADTDSRINLAAEAVIELTSWSTMCGKSFNPWVNIYTERPTFADLFIKVGPDPSFFVFPNAPHKLDIFFKFSLFMLDNFIFGLWQARIGAF